LVPAGRDVLHNTQTRALDIFPLLPARPRYAPSPAYWGTESAPSLERLHFRREAVKWGFPRNGVREHERKRLLRRSPFPAIKRKAVESVCRMHGAAGGAPKGNRNALKHGEFAAKTLALKREIQALARKARETMAAIE
jgi:hypothetical protein